MREIKFEQIPLFTGGYSRLTAELTLHFDGTKNTVEVAYEIRSTDTAEVVELGTLGQLSLLADEWPLVDVLTELRRRTLADLRPF